MKQLYQGPQLSANADIKRLVQDGILEPINRGLPAMAAKSDETRAYLLTIMSAQDAGDLIAHRRAKKCPLTRRAAEGLVKHFSAARAQFGWSVSTCIDHMAAQGWQGFNVNWIMRDKAQTQAAVNQANRQGGGKYMRGRASDAAMRLMQEADDGDRQPQAESDRHSVKCLSSDRKY